MNIAEHPVTENGTDAGLWFMFQEIEQRPHRIAADLPSGGNISRRPKEDGIVSIAGECRRGNQACSHAGLKQFSIPLAVRPSYKLSRVCGANDVADMGARRDIDLIQGNGGEPVDWLSI